MMINIDDINPEKPLFQKPVPNDILVIDNGTYECKAGFKSTSPQIIFRNKIYKYKDQFTLENKPVSSPKTMFEKDLIINYEIMEGTLDYIMNYLLYEKNEYDQEKNEDEGSSEEVFVKKRKVNKDEKVSVVEKKVCNVMPKNLIITNALYAPKMFQVQLISLLFEVYRFKKIQIGVDCFYSYLYNIRKEERASDKIFQMNFGDGSMNPNRKRIETYKEVDLIISISHINTYVLAVQGEKIVKHYKLPFGSQLAADYLLLLIQNKYSNICFRMTNKETNYLLKYVFVGLNYKEKVMEVYNNMLNGNYEFVVDSKTIKYTMDIPEVNQESKKEEKKIRKKAPEPNQIEETPMELIDSVNDDKIPSEDENECFDESIAEPVTPKINPTENMTENEKMYYYLEHAENQLSLEEIKFKRKYSIIYFSTLYRLKQKIEKEKKKLQIIIESTEEELEKQTDIDKYILKIKQRYDKWKKEIKKADRINRELKNKRSKEFMIMMKVNHGSTLTIDEECILEGIEEARDEESREIMQNEYKKYKDILLVLDPEYLYEVNPINIVRGDQINLHGLSIDIELLRVGEVIFEPSLIGMNSPGLTEIFDEFRNDKIKNVLLTGGFSNIKNIDKRIENELNRNSLFGNVNVFFAEDMILDPFKGADFCSAFPVYTIEEFKKEGAENLIARKDKFC